jgi:NADH-quinone oxidoreductase subunit G
VRAAPLVVSLELRESAVTALADVVLPVAPVTEKAGAFVNWEGRLRPFEPALHTNAYPDGRVLHLLAGTVGVDLGLPTAAAAGGELALLGRWGGARPAAPDVSAGVPAAPARGEAVLASWRMLLDAGRLQDGEPHLAATARPPAARLSAATAAEIGAVGGDLVVVSTGRGEVVLPLAVTEMADRVVWLPLNSPGAAVHQRLGVTAGAVVAVGRARR